MDRLLPAAIESALTDAGFSGTEILIIRKLVEEKSLTLRELALKTGKSTGVLDQAMKKLQKKRIVKRGTINGQPRYAIDSLDALTHWVEDDAKFRREALDRRNRDFNAFVESLRIDRANPEIENFQGWDGISKAYTKLLASGEELLTMTPVLTTAEDDPLRAFRVDFFRRRQYRKIFQRVIAPDTPLSRRFRSKDAFEYRSTLLLPETEYPLDFEKTIAGDLVCCINFKDQTACLIRYKELARAERAAFESLWHRRLAEERGKPAPAGRILPAESVVPMKTRTLSRFREFILSKQSIVAFVAFSLLSCAVTGGLYLNARDLSLQRIRERAKSIAATGVLQFDTKDIEAVRTPEDIRKPEYAKLVSILNLIRRNNPGVQYISLYRTTNNPSVLTFIADADSLHPNEQKDLNGDGIIDDADSSALPGQSYNDTGAQKLSEAINGPIADKQPATDQWGTFIAGAAPITDSNGKTTAILGIDIQASEIDRLTLQSFSPVIVLIGFFVLFLLIRFASINKSLLKELINRISLKRWIIIICTFLTIVFSIVYAIYSYTLTIVIEDTGQRLMSIATTAASQFDPNDLSQLHFARDMKSDAYQRVFRKLNEIRNQNPGSIKYAYIFRLTDKENYLEFVADADSNNNLPVIWYDFDSSGELGSGDMNISPGVWYFVNDEMLLEAQKHPAYDKEPVRDQWGQLLSAAAPIIQDKKVVGIIGLDSSMSDVRHSAWQHIIGL